MDEVFRRLELIEKKTDDCASTVGECAKSMQQCATDMQLIQKEMTHKNTLTEKTLESIQNLVETQSIILFGNPRQDSKDRGMVGDVEQLKSTDARKKKLYWLTVPAIMALLVTSFWNSIFGKEDHGRSEETKTTVQKTGPGSGYLHGENRSRRRE
tara:strand:- start:12917 stop:13381 length:465 start_codon:yes stop_codon:yes gene_type:complete